LPDSPWHAVCNEIITKSQIVITISLSSISSRIKGDFKMNTPFKNWKILLMAGLLTIVMAVGASADMGRGYGHRGQMHQGRGWHHGGYGAQGWGVSANLSEEDIKKLDEERKAFLENTKDLRREVYQKRLELASEMAKQNPDPARAANIQKEISDTKAQLAQKQLDHIFRVRKINPDLGMGFRGGDHMGFGMIHSGMMGRGGHGNWGNHDCPYGGRGGGYGIGPGMMGPRGRGGDDSRQYHKGQGSMSE
jgi:Spy/CpxP family protein refolding chaperone